MPETENLSLLSKQICRDAGVELDHDGMDAVREVMNRAGAKWQPEAMDILKQRNPMLLEKLSALENHLNSLLLIAKKPPVLEKEFKTKLKEYEQAIEFCIEYADRHIPKKI
jgi:hypothetical protein